MPIAKHHYPAASLVTWQVAWWALAPLAAGAMTQPCGKVFGVGDKSFRFYSRASPIMCIGDVAHFLLLLILGVSTDVEKSLENIKFELRNRFECEDTADNAQSAENSRLIRWCLMIVGGVPCQTVKLVSMGGIPWTKTWALMYFTSIVVCEILSLVESRIALEGQNPPPTNSQGPTTPNQNPAAPKWRHHQWAWAAGIPFYTAFSLHLALVNSLTGYFGYELLIAIAMALPDTLQPMAAGAMTASVFFVLCALPVYGVFFVVESPGLTVVRSIIWVFLSMVWTLALDPFGVELITLTLRERLIRIGARRVDDSGDLAQDWSLLSVVLTLQILATVLVTTGGSSIVLLPPLKYVSFVNSLLGGRALMLALTTFVFSLLYYGLLYDSQGTNNPSWSGVFG
jgi:hypothetical protein